MNTIDILVEGYAKITGDGTASTSGESTLGGWDASSTTVLITCTNGVITSESEKSQKNVILGSDNGATPESRKDPGQASMTKEGDDKSIIRIIVDPGANRDLLFERLKERELSLDAIDFVFITHHHLDHAMNVGLFPNAKVVDGEAVYTQAKAVEGVDMLAGTDISVIKTPGHEYAHASLVVPTKDGTVVVAGDCFWFEDGQQEEYIKDGEIMDKEKLLNKHDDFAEKMDELVESRKMILNLADWVIPGHGRIWQNKK